MNYKVTLNLNFIGGSGLKDITGEENIINEFKTDAVNLFKAFCKGHEISLLTDCLYKCNTSDKIACVDEFITEIEADMNEQKLREMLKRLGFLINYCEYINIERLEA